MADAVVFFINKKIKHSLINIGTGNDETILTYAKKIMKIMNYVVPIKFDKSKQNGMKRKLLDVSLAKKYGWQSSTSIEEGVKKSYNHLVKNN